MNTLCIYNAIDKPKDKRSRDRYGTDKGKAIEDYIVRVWFQKEEPTIDDKMKEYLRRIAEIHI